SGGTYEYGYRYLRPWLGFLAGVTFMLAKSASAATAALGFAGYLATLTGIGGRWTLAVSFMVTLATVLVVLAGIKRSSAVNVAMVAVSLSGLAVFVVAGVPAAAANGGASLVPFLVPEPGAAPVVALLNASAL